MSDYQILPAEPEHKQRNILFAGRSIGWITLDSQRVGLEQCPACDRENYALSVLSAKCAWCGWSIDKDKLSDAEQPQSGPKPHAIY